VNVRVKALPAFLALLILSGCATLGRLAPPVPGVGDFITVVTTLGSAVMPIGQEEENEIGRSIAANVAGRYGIVWDAELTRYVTLVGRTVAGKSGRPELSYHFAVLDTDIVNAFSCPGGYVFVTRGTLAVIGSEAELAAVLAHEISHVANKDIIKEIEKQKFFQAGNEVAGTLLHADPSILNAVTSFGTGLLFKGLSRSDENASDRLSLVYTAKAGYRPAALLTFLERLKGGAGAADDDVKLLFATHPKIDDRIKNVRKEIEGMPDQGQDGELLSERYIDHVRLQAGLR
jgi:predicted Zn-dependent protease